jgi:hypothetical protein
MRSSHWSLPDRESDLARYGDVWSMVSLVRSVEEPGKDPRANESGSKGCGKIAQGASARAARHIHSVPAKQYNDAAPSIVSTGEDSSREHADKGSVPKGQARGRMSYSEAARGKLPFQQP